MREEAAPGLLFRGTQELDATSDQLLVGRLNILDLERNGDETPGQVSSFRITRIDPLECQVGRARIELGPALLWPGKVELDSKRFLVERKGPFPVPYDDKNAIELVVHSRLGATRLSHHVA